MSKARPSRRSAITWVVVWAVSGCADLRETPRLDVVYEQVACSAPWSPRYGHTNLVFQGRMWVLGGTEAGVADDGAFHLKNDIWSSADGVRWRLEAPAAPWPARFSHNSLVFHDRIWVFGGLTRYIPVPDRRPDVPDAKVNANDVWCSEDGVNWTEVTPAAPWPARHVFTSVVHNDRMYVIGGAGSSYYNDVWSSSDGRNWMKMEGTSPRFVPRKNLVCVSFRGKIWVLAGVILDPAAEGDKKNHPVNDVWSSPDGCNWAQTTASAPWSPRGLPAVVVYRGRIWLAEGREGRQCETFARDVWHSPDGLTWIEEAASPPWSPRYWKPVVFGESVWALGGCAEGVARLNDVWRLTWR